MIGISKHRGRSIALFLLGCIVLALAIFVCLQLHTRLGIVALLCLLIIVVISLEGPFFVALLEAKRQTPDADLSALAKSERRMQNACVLVSEADSGPGLDLNSAYRFFDAFYTTMPQGMGMGLSIARSIIEDYGGRQWTKANAPKGALFQFTLPIAND
jgi:phosphoglycerate-specific signal transduction histidine kinase